MWTRTHIAKRIAMIAAWLVTSPALCAQEAKREQIGVVLGTPVFRDELPADDFEARGAALHRLFSAPVWKEYETAHRIEIRPTEREIEFALAYFRKEHEAQLQKDGERLRRERAGLEERLKQPDLSEDAQRDLRSQIKAIEFRMRPPPRSVAEYHLNHRKLQRHLYQKFGGGRILFQQAGLEAFDAMHEYWKQQEKDGKFRIDDEQLRAQFYSYWTMAHPAGFLTSDKEQVHEFLNPPFLLQSESQPASRPSDGG